MNAKTDQYGAPGSGYGKPGRCAVCGEKKDRLPSGRYFCKYSLSSEHIRGLGGLIVECLGWP